MKLYIIPLKKGYAVEIVDRYEFEFDTLQEVTKRLGEFSDGYFHKTGERSTIKILSIPNPTMATKKTYPAKPLKAVAKKKVAKKAGKK